MVRDTLYINDGTFTALLRGRLTDGELAFGTVAQDNDDFLIYDDLTPAISITMRMPMALAGRFWWRT